MMGMMKWVGQSLAARKAGKGRRGFTLIELAIVLSVASLLFAGLWRLMASGNTQLRDQATADQHKQIIAATQAFLSNSNGQNWMVNNILTGVGAVANLPFPATNTNITTCQASYANVDLKAYCNFLPTGFTASTMNPYGQTYVLQVRNEDAVVTAGQAPKNYSFMIVTNDAATAAAIPDSSGGRIANLIGGDGGFVYSTNVCGSPVQSFGCGSFGTWVATLANYNIARSHGGYVASRSYAGIYSSLDTPWLARKLMNPTSDFNTLQTHTYMLSGGTLGFFMQGNTITGTTELNPTASSTYGGALRNFGEILAGRAGSTGTAALTLVSCKGAAGVLNDPACDNIMNVRGDIGVDGKIVVETLFALSYIYKPSDIRLKTEIKPIENALDKIAKIKGYTYVMKNDGRAHLGVVAQEVEKVFPTAVSATKDDEVRSVDYSELIAPLIAAVNELREQNASLKQQLDEQAKQLKELKGRGASHKL